MCACVCVCVCLHACAGCYVSLANSVSPDVCRARECDIHSEDSKGMLNVGLRVDDTIKTFHLKVPPASSCCRFPSPFLSRFLPSLSSHMDIRLGHWCRLVHMFVWLGHWFMLGCAVGALACCFGCCPPCSWTTSSMALSASRRSSSSTTG